jgi:hypothetical protein
MSISRSLRSVVADGTLIALIPALVACSSDSVGAPEESNGVANLMLQEVPEDVQCFRAVAAGSTRTEERHLDVVAGQSSQSFRLERLPIGNVEFSGFAYSAPCSEVTNSTVAEWVSEPVTAAILRGVVAEVALVMRRNGRSNVSVDFPDDELCSVNAEPCLNDGDCCSGSCQAGICGPEICASQVNFALNTTCTEVPSPNESDHGWGGGSFPCDLVDGLHSYSTWARGLAFTGGHETAAGGPPWIEGAGIRHAVIDLGTPRTFEEVVIWHHGVEHTPEFATLEYWNGSAWTAIEPVERLYGTMHAEGTNSGSSDSDIYTFPAVTGSKVRYSFDNRLNNIIGTFNIHGWLYEFEVFGCSTDE